MNHEARMHGALDQADREVNDATDLLEQLVELVAHATMLQASPPLVALTRRARDWSSAEVREASRRRRQALLHEADRRSSV